jgi:hypothetical protein
MIITMVMVIHCFSVSFASGVYTYYISKGKDYYSTEYYDASHPLRAAAKFHIFTLHDLELNAHTNGNVAAGYMKVGNSNSGTNNLMEGEVTYIRDFDDINSKVFANNDSTLVVGPDILTRPSDNGNKIALKSSTMSDYREMDGIVKRVGIEFDESIRFIDLEKEFAYFEELSQNLAKHTKFDATIKQSDFNDFNSRKISVAYDSDVNSDCFNVNITADALGYNTDLIFDGYDTQGKKSIVVNVDLAGYKDFCCNSKIRLIDENGKQIANRERTSWEYGKVLWNFYDSSQPDSVYRGSIQLAEFIGSILAPGASVTANQNFDGTVISNNFANFAQTHRNDFMGVLPVIAFDTDGDDGDYDDNSSSSSTTTESTTQSSTSTTTTESTTVTTTVATTESTTETTTSTSTSTTQSTTTTTEKTTESTTATTTVASTTQVTTETTTESTTRTSTTVTTTVSTETTTETTTEDMDKDGGKQTTTTSTTTVSTTEATTTTASTTETTTESTTTAVTSESSTESTTATTSESTTVDEGNDKGSTESTTSIEESATTTESTTTTTTSESTTESTTTTTTSESTTESTTT